MRVLISNLSNAFRSGKINGNFGDDVNVTDERKATC